MRFGPFLVISLLLLILWAGGFLMFHIASGLIHLLLLFAVISFIAHLVMGSRTA
ncbi:MAG: lmo0937 family membrane protein [Candidatus Sulfotelmatobacter sp.]